MTAILTKEEAIEKGENKFYTGVRCGNHHDCQRYVLDGKCVKCVSAEAKSCK